MPAQRPGGQGLDSDLYHVTKDSSNYAYVMEPR